MKFRIFLFSFGVVLITSWAEGGSKVLHRSRRHGFSFNVCELPPVAGMCNAYAPSYWYNSKTKSCERFIYGGCGGNANNFGSRESCEKACGEGFSFNVCELPQVEGMCRAYAPRYWYNSKTKSCERFIYGGCGGNANNFGSRESCGKACGEDYQAAAICEQPIDPGICNVNYPERYGFNSKTKKCELFVYGGCGGNRNNFGSYEACRRTCEIKSASINDKGDICYLSPEAVPCIRGVARIYYFDSSSGTCKRLDFGECGGNDNSFTDIASCEKACKK